MLPTAGPGQKSRKDRKTDRCLVQVHTDDTDWTLQKVTAHQKLLKLHQTRVNIYWLYWVQVTSLPPHSVGQRSPFTTSCWKTKSSTATVQPNDSFLHSGRAIIYWKTHLSDRLSLRFIRRKQEPRCGGERNIQIEREGSSELWRSWK